MSSSLGRWARSLFDGLVAAGVREVVVSPGSRSTPWLLEACRRPELDIVDVVDERSASFFALGQARATGRPSLLLCTSGTAPSHYLPAVIEASQARLPLIVLSADRPLDRLDCGAPQVTDQSHLYGKHVRSFVELGEPREADRAVRAVASRVVQAVSASRWPCPGPVHLNARARKPLEPEDFESRNGGSSTDESKTKRSASTRVPRVVRPELEAPTAAAEQLAVALRQCRQPILVAGPAALAQAKARAAVHELASTAGVPLFADATSQLRFGGTAGVEGHQASVLDAGSALLESAAFRARFVPDLILQLGAAPVSSGWERWLTETAAGEAFHAVVTESVWHDPARTADLFVFAELEGLCRALCDEIGSAATGVSWSEWRQNLAAANRKAREIAESVAVGAGRKDSDSDRNPEDLSEAAVARTVASSVPPGGLLAVGNSLPIRWLDLFAPIETRAIKVWSQRGVNGIDGLVSGAAGTSRALVRASAGARAGAEIEGRCHCPATVLLVGDLTLLHDLGGLATLVHVPQECAFVIVVVHNGGGRIFEQLPVARLGLDEAMLDHWTTPNDRSFDGISAAFGLAHHRVSKAAELSPLLESALEGGGASLIEARVPEHGARRELELLRVRLDAAFDDSAPRASDPKASDPGTRVGGLE